MYDVSMINSIPGRIFESLIAELFNHKIIGNLYRPHYVERLVAIGLGSGFTLKSEDWAGWDIEYNDQVRIEVKQSAALQTWTDRESLGGRPTSGAFDIAPRKGFFHDGGTKFEKRPGRPADIYIFAWHPVENRETCDQRRPDQWRFFIVPAAKLPDKQKTISRRVIERSYPSIGFEELRPVILSALDVLEKG